VSLPPTGCPPLWKPAVAPLNPALKCVPDFVTSGLTSDGPPPPGTCPEGWNVAAPPLNPALRCVPGFIAAAVSTRT
jgi:hypothetical protein